MSDTHAACINFVNALERISGTIVQYENNTAKLRADLPVLEGVVAKSWGKEDELKQLKSDLAAFDRKITAEIALKKEEVQQEVNEIKTAKQQPASKTTMVAEPRATYHPRAFQPR